MVSMMNMISWIDKKELSKKRLVFIIVTVLIMIFIFIQSSLPADLSQAESNWLIRLIPGIGEEEAVQLTFYVRKSAHFLEYTLLGASIYMAARGRHQLLNSWLIATAYAISDEIHQHFIPGRSCELRDICIDSLGSLSGILMVKMLVYMIKLTITYHKERRKKI